MSDGIFILLVLGGVIGVPIWALTLIEVCRYPTPMADHWRPLGLNLIITVCIWLPLTLPVLLLAVLLRLCLPSRIVNTKTYRVGGK
jgi:hypothetical protein